MSAAFMKVNPMIEKYNINNIFYSFSHNFTNQKRYDRNIKIDILKGILIIFVVAAHSYWKLRKIIFWFHMPAFFIISGYLILIPDKADEKNWLCRKFKNLLIPHLSYTLLIGLFNIGSGIKDYLIHIERCLVFVEKAAGVYWFIPVLFLSQAMIVFIENRIKNTKLKLLIYSAMYVTGIIESLILIPPNTIKVPLYTMLPFNIDVCLLAIPYMIIGYYLRQNIERIKPFFESESGSICIIISSFALSFILFYFKAFDWLTLDLKYSQYKNIIFDLVCPVVFTSLLWLISSFISKIWLGKVLSYIGERSIIIMYLHLLIRDKLIVKLLSEEYSIFIYAFIVIVICLLFDFIISCFPSIAPYFSVKAGRKQ